MLLTFNMFADINHGELDADTISFFGKIDPDYRDQILNDHIYDIPVLLGAIVDGDIPPPPRHVMDQLQEIGRILMRSKACYLRII